MGRRIVGHLLSACAIVTLLFALYLDSFLVIEPLATDELTVWSDGWTVSEGDVILDENVTLPYVFEGPFAGRLLTVYRRIPSLPNRHTALLIHTSMAALEVAIDQEPIYTYAGPANGWKRPVFGGATPHFVRISDEMVGKTLLLTYAFTSNNVFSGHIQAVKVGSKASLILDQFSDWPSLVFGFSLLLVGSIIALSSLFIQTKAEGRSFFYLGAILIALGSWVFSQTPSKFLLIRNPALPMNLSFIALHLLPTLLVSYITHSYPVKERMTPFKIVSHLFVVAYIALFFLQLAGVLQYTDSLIYSGAALALFLLALFSVLLWLNITENRQLLSFLLALGCILFSILAEVVLLALNIQLSSAVLLHSAMVFSAIILFSHSLMLLKDRIKYNLKEEVLFTLAYTDALTSLANRAAFERDVDAIVEAAHGPAVGIIMMDINDLKSINDSEGHAKGDQVIVDFARRIEVFLPPGSKLYRYGGDEFIATVNASDAESLTDSIVRFFASNKEITYQIAAGSYIYTAGGKRGFGEVVSLADSAMYRCKRAMKGGATRSPQP